MNDCKTKVFIIVFSIVLTFSPLRRISAQNEKEFILKGEVYNSITKKPVDFGTVVILEAKIKKHTKEDGSYEIIIPEPGKYTVIIRSSGYKILRTRITIDRNITRDFRLVPLRTRGTTIVITSDRDIQKLSRHTMTVHDLKSVPGSFGDAINALTTLPGVIRPFGMFGGLVIRGKDAQTHNYFVDDIPLFTPMHYGGMHSVINNNMMSEIDLYSSAFPASYGSATSAIIAINTVDEVKEFDGYTDIGLLSMSCLFMTPIYKHETDGLKIAGPSYVHDKDKNDKRGYSIFSARYGYLTLAVRLLLLLEPEAPEIVPEYWDYQSKTKYYLDKNHSLTLLLFGNYDYLKMAYERDEEDIKEDRQERGEDDDRYEDDPLMISIKFKTDLQTHTQGLFYAYHPSKRFSNTIKCFSVLNQNYMYIYFEGENIPDALSGINIDARPNIFGAKNITKLEWWEKYAEIRTGLEFTFYKFLGTGRSLYINPGLIEADQGRGPPSNDAFFTYILDEDIENRMWGGYIENKFTFWGLTLTPGFRSDYLERAKTYTEDPRVLLAYELPTKTTLSAAYGKYSYFFQVNPRIFNVNMDLCKLGKELKPDRAIHRVGGIEQEIGMYTVKIETYQNHFFDMPLPYPHHDEEGNFIQGLNSGQTKTRGLEMMIRKNIHENANGPYGWVSYTYTEAKYRSGLPTEPGYLGVESNPVGDLNGDQWYHSSLEQRHSAKLAGGYVYGKNTLGVRVDYYTGFPYTPIVDTEYDEAYNVLYGGDRWVAVYGEENSKYYPPFCSIDIRYTYKIYYSWGYVSWYAEVINANNTQPIDNEEFDRSRPYKEGENPVLEAPEGAIINWFPSFGVEVKF